MNKHLFAIISSLILFVASSQAVVYNWSIKNGDTVESFKEISLTIEDATTITQNWGTVELYRTADNLKLAYTSVNWDASTSTATMIFPDYQLWPDYPLSTDGEYKVVLNEGIFTIDDIPNQQQSVVFNVDSPDKFITISDVEINPAPTVFESVFDEITITLPDKVTSVDFNEVVGDYYGNTKITAKAQFILNGSSYGEFDMSADKNIITLTPSDELAQRAMRQGNWFIRILPDAMYFNGDTNNTNAPLSFGPYVYPNFVNININPVENEIVSLKKFSLYFDTYGAEIILPTDDKYFPTLNKYNNSTNEYEYVATFNLNLPDASNEFEYPKADLTLTDNDVADCLPGNYKIIVPKGAFSIIDPYYGTASSNLLTEVEYSLIEKPNVNTIPSWSIKDGDTVDSFSEITMTFEGATNISYKGEFSTPYITINKVNEDGSITTYPKENASGSLSVKINENTVTLYMDKDAFAPYYPIDTDGTYQIIVPEGKFAFENIDSFVNDELKLTFNIDAIDPVITDQNTSIILSSEDFNPYSSSFQIIIENVNGELTVLNETITKSVWDEEKMDYVEVTESAPYKAQLRYDYGGYYEQVVAYYDITEDVSSLILNLAQPIIPEEQFFAYGDYYVYLPKKAVCIAGDINLFNDELKFGPFGYKYRAAGEFITPQQNEVLSEIQTVTIYFPNETATPQLSSENSEQPKLFFFNKYTSEYQEVATFAVSQDNNENPYQFILSLESPISKGGKYKVVVPRNTVIFVDEENDNTYDNESMEIEFTIEGEKNVSLESVSEIPLNELKLTVEPCNNIMQSQSSDNQITLSIVNDDNPTIVGFYSALINSNNSVTLTLTADTFLKSGNYIVDIPQGYFTFDSYPNENIIIYFDDVKFAEINQIISDNEKLTIFNTNGILIKDNATFSELIKLDEGIYIVNGKKIIIKR